MLYILYISSLFSNKILIFSLWVLAARIGEILESVGLAQEGLASNVVSSAQVLANVANLLNIRDTELSRCVLEFWVLSFTLNTDSLSSHCDKKCGFYIVI